MGSEIRRCAGSAKGDGVGDIRETGSPCARVQSRARESSIGGQVGASVGIPLRSEAMAAAT